MPSKRETSTNSLQGHITEAVSSLGKMVSSPISRILSGKTRRERRVAASPGIEYASGVDQRPVDGTIGVECIDYGKGRFERQRFTSVEELLAHPRADWAEHRWINIEGLHPFVINELRKAYRFHTLAAEDALHTPQRPKLELYENHSLVIVEMARLQDDQLVKEQVSFMVLQDALITFQERPGDIWDPVRARVKKPESRFHKHGIWYLVYALIDAVVDNIFPILERYGDALADLEEQAMDDPKPSVQQSIYIIKRELYGLRRSMWPLRELASKFTTDETLPIDKETRVFMRDVQDHAVQIIELVDSSREMANSLQDFYISTVSNRMNEVMKALTVMASLFLPITFLAGVYGMNFEHIPELAWPYAYPVFWGACLLVIVGLLWYFKRKDWI